MAKGPASENLVKTSESLKLTRCHLTAPSPRLASNIPRLFPSKLLYKAW